MLVKRDDYLQLESFSMSNKQRAPLLSLANTTGKNKDSDHKIQCFWFVMNWFALWPTLVLEVDLAPGREIWKANPSVGYRFCLMLLGFSLNLSLQSPCSKRLGWGSSELDGKLMIILLLHFHCSSFLLLRSQSIWPPK